MIPITVTTSSNILATLIIPMVIPIASTAIASNICLEL